MERKKSTEISLSANSTKVPNRIAKSAYLPINPDKSFAMTRVYFITTEIAEFEPKNNEMKEDLLPCLLLINRQNLISLPLLFIYISYEFRNILEYSWILRRLRSLRLPTVFINVCFL